VSIPCIIHDIIL